MSRHTRALDLIESVLDEDSFQSWDQAMDYASFTQEYRAQLDAAAARTGLDESVITGRGTVHGRSVAVVVNDFGFLAGSIGRAAAGRIVAAVERATRERIPVLASTASGGTRMQEGTQAFVRMADITRAVVAHRAQGLPYLVHLRHPTTGGVYASWGSLGHITIAEPGALIGFLGPKVYEGLNGRPFRPGVQTAENLAANGVIDGVVPTEQLRGLVDAALAVLIDPPRSGAMARRRATSALSPDVWRSVEQTRRADRAGVRDLLKHGGKCTVQLRGTDEGERDSSVLVALTRLDNQPCVVVGQDRARQTPAHPMGAAALREARRGIRLAEELRLPLVTVIDTPGAELSPRAEEGAIAGEIARCLAALTGATVPSVSVLMGQGCGGGALALLPAHRVIAAEHAWLSPLPPEGASIIVHGNASMASQMAQTQRISATDLYEDGVVHQLVPEHDGEPAHEFAVAMAAAIGVELAAQQAGRGVGRARVTVGSTML